MTDIESGHIRLSGNSFIDSNQDMAAESFGDERHIRYSEIDVLKCFESPGAELDVVNAMAMFPGVSKRRVIISVFLPHRSTFV